jgi:hypothetical protein
MLKSILWKEWREQRWKLAFGTVLLVFVTGSLAAARLTSDREIYVVIGIFGGMILALYSAMGTFAPEHTNGTTGFLAARPVNPRTVFLVKWFFGWLNFAIPIVLCCGILYFIQGRELRIGDRFYYVYMFLWGIWMSTMFYTLTCCLALRRGGEGTVGITGLAIVVIFFIHMAAGTFGMTSVLSPDMRELITFDKILTALYLFLNPYMAWFLYLRVEGWLFWFFMFWIEQAVLFAVVLMYGMRRWRRSF